MRLQGIGIERKHIRFTVYTVICFYGINWLSHTFLPKWIDFFIGLPLSFYFMYRGGLIYLDYKFYSNYGRNKSDPEKCVLPTILFINSNHYSFNEYRRSGFMICFGWWDFSVKFGLFSLKNTNDESP